MAPVYSIERARQLRTVKQARKPQIALRPVTAKQAAKFKAQQALALRAGVL